MQVHTFTADSAAQAVEQIREQLGPQALVLNVRRLPAEGLARLWQRARIEVLAALPEAPAAAPADALTDLRQELVEFKQQVTAREASSAERFREAAPAATSLPIEPDPSAPPPQREGESSAQLRTGFSNNVPSPVGWRVGELLEHSGLMPAHVHQVMDAVRASLGEQPPATLAEELWAARAALLGLWRAPQSARSNLHVFVGPPGAGKTTALTKWLADAVLVQGRRARVWRLDGHVANTAESLSVFADILGVPVERFPPDDNERDASELVLVDLPGVSANDVAMVNDLKERLKSFPEAQIHLVLNAAYDTRLLLRQGRAYSALPVSDVILTHLDEETRWGKVWNFVLGTKYTVGYLSTGQNIPGDFLPADPQTILARYLPVK